MGERKREFRKSVMDRCSWLLVGFTFGLLACMALCREGVELWVIFLLAGFFFWVGAICLRLSQ